MFIDHYLQHAVGNGGRDMQDLKADAILFPPFGHPLPRAARAASLRTRVVNAQDKCDRILGYLEGTSYYSLSEWNQMVVLIHDLQQTLIQVCDELDSECPQRKETFVLRQVCQQARNMVCRLREQARSTTVLVDGSNLTIWTTLLISELQMIVQLISDIDSSVSTGLGEGDIFGLGRPLETE
jgi:hypothetical protein